MSKFIPSAVKVNINHTTDTKTKIMTPYYSPVSDET
jgi:hypothetical protein